MFAKFCEIAVKLSVIIIQLGKNGLKVHKRENFLGSDIEICTFS